MRSLNALQPFGLLALRLALGVIFFAHGYPKLAHLGGGMQGFFVEHGLPGYFVYVAGVLEVFGGLMLMLGLFTRPAALVLALEIRDEPGRYIAQGTVKQAGEPLLVRAKEAAAYQLAGKPVKDEEEK